MANKRKPSAQYEEKASQLLNAIKIHEDVVRESKDLTAAQKKLVLDGLASDRKHIVNSESKTMEALRYIEGAVVQPFNEMTGPDADKFWQRIAEARLDFQRRDVVREILERNRIKDRVEYEIVIDTEDALLDAGKITAAEAKKLQALVDRYERTER
jgi:hypothetical protein